MRIGPQPISAPAWWRALAYLAAVAPVGFIAASLWMQPDLGLMENPDWKPVIALAEELRGKGDFYEARALYFRAVRIASRQDDWAGLLAAACGVHRLTRSRGPYSDTHPILTRAMMAAEKEQSRGGIFAVAEAFRSLGEHDAASMVLSRIRPDWPEEAGNGHRAEATGCRETGPPGKTVAARAENKPEVKR